MKRISKEKFELMKEYRRFSRKNFPIPLEKEHKQKGAYKRKKFRIVEIEQP